MLLTPPPARSVGSAVVPGWGHSNQKRGKVGRRPFERKRVEELSPPHQIAVDLGQLRFSLTGGALMPMTAASRMATYSALTTL